MADRSNRQKHIEAFIRLIREVRPHLRLNLLWNIHSYKEMAKSISSRKEPAHPRMWKAVGFILQGLWRGEIVSIAFALLYGSGVGAMYAHQYIIAICLYLVSVAWAATKILTLEDARKHQERRLVSALILVAGGVVFVVSMLWLRHSYNQEHPVREQAGQPASTSSQSTSQSSPVPPPTSQPTFSVPPPIERTAKIAVMIPFDTAAAIEKKTPIPLDQNPDDPLFMTYGDFQELAMRGQVPEDVRNTKDEGQISWTPRPISSDEAPSFLRSVLQYYIFQTIDLLQRDSMTTFINHPAHGQAGIEPPDAEVYPYDRLVADIGENIFLKTFRYSHHDPSRMQAKPIRVPKGTVIRFMQDSKISTVRFRRADYYTADFSVRQFIGSGLGNVPEHFVTSRLATTMEWEFIVEMRYSINQSKGDDFNPNTYAKWLDSLFDGLNKRLTLN